MDMGNDLELERCDEELKRIEERRKKILERKNRRLRQIREKQLKDKEAWMKKLIPLLDKTLQDRFGALYWYGISAEDICEGAAQMEPVNEPDEGKEITVSVIEEPEKKNKQLGRDEE